MSDAKPVPEWAVEQASAFCGRAAFGRIPPIHEVAAALAAAYARGREDAAAFCDGEAGLAIAMIEQERDDGNYTAAERLSIAVYACVNCAGGIRKGVNPRGPYAIRAGSS